MSAIFYSLWYLFIVSVPFGTRLFLGSVTPGFHEYESFFLYASDLITVALFFWFFLWKGDRLAHFIKAAPRLSRLLIALFFVAGFSVFLAPSAALSVYVLARFLILGLIAFLVFPYVFAKEKHRLWTIALVAALAVDQAVLGILQFLKQGSIGLSLLGESVLSNLDPATASIWYDGARLVRAYGLFPHPNILSLFLVIGLICLGYLYIEFDVVLYQWDKSISRAQNGLKFIKNWRFSARILVAISFFLVFTGLMLTFSRAGWLVGALSLAIFIAFTLRAHFRAALRFLALVLITFSLGYFFFSPLLTQRAASLVSGTPAVDYRIAYNEMGLDIILRNPLGVGLGNQVLYGVETRVYQGRGMNSVSEWEPIHNIFVLAMAELGILGGTFFLLLFFLLFWQIFQRTPTLLRSLSVSLLGAVTIFGLFDHFLWDLHSGRMMLFLVLGFVFSEVILFSKKELYS